LTLIRCALGFAVIVFTGAVMVAWLTRSTILSAAAPDFGVMVFNTALCLALLGSSLMLMDNACAWRRWTTRWAP
jgi:hypothetical protein